MKPFELLEFVIFPRSLYEFVAIVRREQADDESEYAGAFVKDIHSINIVKFRIASCSWLYLVYNIYVSEHGVLFSYTSESERCQQPSCPETFNTERQATICSETRRSDDGRKSFRSAHPTHAPTFAGGTGGADLGEGV